MAGTRVLDALIPHHNRLVRFLRTPLYGNAFYLILSNGMSSALGFVFWLVAARIYTTDEVGIASAAISAIALVGMISHLGLGFGLIRFLPGTGREAVPVINSCLVVVMLVTTLVALVYVAGIRWWSPALGAFHGSAVDILIFVAYGAATSVSTILEDATIASRRSVFVMGKALIFNGLKLALLPLMAYAWRSMGIFNAWGIALIVSILFTLLFFLPRVYPGYRFGVSARPEQLRNLVRFSAGNYVAQFLTMAPGLILPLLVVNLLGAQANAFFYIAWAFATAVMMIPTSISMSLFVEGSYDEARLWASFIKSLKITLLILIPLAMLVFVLADRLLVLYGGAYAASSTTLLRWLTVALVPASVVRIYYGVLRAQHRLRLLISLNLFIAAATLIGSYLLLPGMGINAAGLAWISSNTAVLLWIIAASARRRQIFLRLLHRGLGGERHAA
jgi:O-antigen/teichoic acid export membrane protein